MQDWLFLLAIFIPLGFSVLLPFISFLGGWVARNSFAVLGGLVTGVITLLLISHTQNNVVFKLNWLPGIVDFSLYGDALSICISIIAGVIGALVLIYSLRYMEREEDLSRYYSLTLLFIGSMIGMALSANFIFLFFFWEIIGICSYALIGFFYKDPKAANAGLKAFITTRIGDAGLLAGILLLYHYAYTFDIQRIIELAGRGEIPQWVITWSAFLMLAGAVGKSAQIPLQVWLPDAMEAPTTISALIHAATLVNAGVYLVARVFPLFSGVSYWLLWVAWIGALSLFLTGCMALVEKDLKRVLAYSTISQLGYMMFALGVSGWLASIFHLFNHAIFKALLFLCAGAIIHTLHTKNMYEMGGLRKEMPLTFLAFLIGTSALAGIPLFSGFWSKEMILGLGAEKFNLGFNLPFILAELGVLLTMAYSTRMIWLVFMGEGKRKEEKVKDAPIAMTGVLIILVLLTLLAWLPISQFSFWLSSASPILEGEVKITLRDMIVETFTNPITYISILAIILGYLFYLWRKVIVSSLGKLGKGLYSFAKAGFGFNELYYWIGYRMIDFAKIWLDYVDERAINSFNYLVGNTSLRWGEEFRKTHTGILNLNILGVVIGLLLIILILR